MADEAQDDPTADLYGRVIALEDGRLARDERRGGYES